jgi:hypothetical protein
MPRAPSTKAACFEPHFGCIYESGKWRSFVADSPNPKTLPAIDLSVPEPTSEEVARAKLWKAVEAAREALEGNRREGNPKALLEAARDIIQSAEREEKSS